MSHSFQTLGVGAPLVRALAARKIHRPFAIQALVLPDALAGLDVIAESPTGSGKTLAFGLPLIERVAGASRRPAGLVLVPTRELASQVADELAPLAHVRKLRVATVYGGVPLPPQATRARSAEIVVATPGRLQDLLDRRLVSLASVRVVVLDEADRMLDMGFRPQVMKILAQVPTNRQTMLFSATLSGAVAELARDYTVTASRFHADPPVERKQGLVEHQFVAVTAEDKVERLADHLAAADGLALVFVRTKRGADRLARRLGRDHSIAAAAMHGDMSQRARETALARFESGAVATLVATDVAARGLDVDDVTHVINFDPPHGRDDYVHRVGRTGRAGRPGSGVTLVLPEQRSDVRRLAASLGHDASFGAARSAAHGTDSAATGKTQRRRQAPRRNGSGRSQRRA